MRITCSEDGQNLIGKEIEFADEIEDYEIYAEPRMRATVVDFIFDRFEGDETVHIVTVNYERYEVWNRLLETPNWWGNNGGLVSARESGQYSGSEAIYCDNNLPFEVIE